MKKYLILVVGMLLTFNTIAYPDTPSPTPNPDSSPCSWVGDKLQSAMVETITKATAVAGDAKDFIAKQLPDVIKQLLRWKFAESLFGCFFPILIFVSFLTVASKLWIKMEWNAHGEPKDAANVIRLICAVASSIGMVISLLAVFFCVNLTWLQIWLAPKVYLIEYAKSMIHH